MSGDLEPRAMEADGAAAPGSLAAPVYENSGQQLPHVPTEELRHTVESLARIGTPQTDIAEAINIDPKTLRKYYRDELHAAALLANSRVAASLFSKATSDTHPGAVTAAIFWLKTRAQWAEPAEKATNQLADAMAEFSRLFGAGPVLNHAMRDITPERDEA